MITLYNLDCMEYMRTLPDKAFDLAIVDPPYGMGSVTYMPRTRKKAHGGFIDSYDITIATIDNNQRSNIKTAVCHSQSNGNKHFGDENVSPSPEYFDELFRVSSHQIIWGGNYFLLPPTRGFICWRKTTVAETFSMAMCEYAWTSFNVNAKYFECAPQGNAKDPRIHPTQKPVALYKWLLQRYAKPGWSILDTHLGSGSIAIACHDDGFDLTGCEIDQDYFAAAQKRLETHQKQMTFEFQEALL